MSVPNANTLPMPPAGDNDPAQLPPQGEDMRLMETVKTEVTISPLVWMSVRDAVQTVQTYKNAALEAQGVDSLAGRTGITAAEYDSLFMPEDSEEGGGITYKGRALTALEKKAIFEQMQATGIVGITPDEATGQYDVVWRKKHKPQESTERFEPFNEFENGWQKARVIGRRAIGNSVYMHKRRIHGVKRAIGLDDEAAERAAAAPARAAEARAAGVRQQDAAVRKDLWQRSERTTTLKLEVDPEERQNMRARIALEYRLGRSAVGTPRPGGPTNNELNNPTAVSYIDEKALEDLDDEYKELFRNGSIMLLNEDINNLVTVKEAAGIEHSQAVVDARNEVIDRVTGADDPDKDVPSEVKSRLVFAVNMYGIRNRQQSRPTVRRGSGDSHGPSGGTPDPGASTTGPSRGSGGRPRRPNGRQGAPTNSGAPSGTPDPGNGSAAAPATTS